MTDPDPRIVYFKESDTSRDERCVKVGELRQLRDELLDVGPAFEPGAFRQKVAARLTVLMTRAQAHECDGGLRGALELRLKMWNAINARTEHEAEILLTVMTDVRSALSDTRGVDDQ